MRTTIPAAGRAKTALLVSRNSLASSAATRSRSATSCMTAVMALSVKRPASSFMRCELQAHQGPSEIRYIRQLDSLHGDKAYHNQYTLAELRHDEALWMKAFAPHSQGKVDSLDLGKLKERSWLRF